MFGMVAESDARLCLMTMGSRGELDAMFLGEGGSWVPNSHAVTLPARRHLSWPHALQRGHLLLEDKGDRGLYAHTISSVYGVEPPNHGLGDGKLLEMGAEGPAESLSDGRIPSCGTRPFFVPVRTVSPVSPAKTPAAKYNESHMNEAMQERLATSHQCILLPWRYTSARHESCTGSTEKTER